MVLKGEVNTTPRELPIIVPELQNRSVISVVGGLSHFDALASSGKLLTWGEYSCGALGLGDPDKLPLGSPGGDPNLIERGQYGDPPDVTVPSEVRFDHGSEAKGRAERYCFAVAASRWNTAALVVDLAEDEVLPESPKQHP
jgi:SCF-associated factor 1